MTEQSKLCVVCAGEAGPITVGDFPVCYKPLCLSTAKEWHANGGKHRGTYYENEAGALAGKAGGKLLVSEFGVTDMSKLSREQWGRFIDTILSTYRAELQRLAVNDEIPF